MTKKLILAPALALALGLALTATPAMAQSAQGGLTIASNPIQRLIALLLPAVQSAREAAR